MSISSKLNFALRSQPESTNIFLSRSRPSVTYEQVADTSAAFSAGLRFSGIKRRSCVGIAMNNCYEWLIADFACAFGDYLSVGIHPSWSPSKINIVLRDTNAAAIIVSREALHTLQQSLLSTKKNNSTLIIVIETNETPNTSTPFTLPTSTSTITYMTYSQVIEIGNLHPTTNTGYGFSNATHNLDLEDNPSLPYTLMYSSGTSGGPPKATATPKSLWLLSNCMPGAFSQFSIWERRAVSYLSLSHGADRGVCWQAVFAGGTIGFASCGEENLSQLLNDMKLFQPTFLLGMANFWSAVYARHLLQLNATIDETLIKTMLGDSESEVDQKQIKKILICKSKNVEQWKMLRSVFLSTRAGGSLRVQHLDMSRKEMGGHLLTVATGGSLTPKVVREFMSYLLTDGNETRVKDAYGLTEFPGISVNGEISTDIDLRLGPVVRNNNLVYDPNDPNTPRGEIIVRKKRKVGYPISDLITYWQRPDLDLINRDVAKFDKDGWYYTGDVGELDYCDRSIPNQFHVTRSVVGHSQWRGAPALLRVIDRVKNLEEIYWEGDSEWISVSRLEGIFQSSLSKCVKHVVLVSDRNESGLIAICLLTEDVASLTSMTLLTLLQNVGVENELKSYEIPLGVVCVQASEQVGLSTITGKPKRALIKNKYHSEWMSKYTTVGDTGKESNKEEKNDIDGNIKSQEETDAISIEIKQLSVLFKDTAANERGVQSTGTTSIGINGSQSNRPLPIKRGDRQVDLRIRLYTAATTTTSLEHKYEELEVLPSKYSDSTVRGRDWLEDMEHSADTLKMERKFEFYQVRSCAPSCDEMDEKWVVLKDKERKVLNDALEKVRSAALVIRRNNKTWEDGFKVENRNANLKKEQTLTLFQTHVEKCVEQATTSTTDQTIINASASFLQGKVWMQRAKNAAERVRMSNEQRHALQQLEESQQLMVRVGDALNVNCRNIPYAWSVNNEWMVNDWRHSLVVIKCPMCSRKVIESSLAIHTDWTKCTDNGIASPEQIDAANSADNGDGVNIGETAVICDVTGANIDSESQDLHDPVEQGVPLSICPIRKARLRGLSSGVYRFPWVHRALSKLYSCIDKSNPMHLAWWNRINTPTGKSIGDCEDVWCNDKQGLHWLFDWVKYAGGPPFERTNGKTNTPASLVVRACDAFEHRPCLGVPITVHNKSHSNASLLGRCTSYAVLTDAAGMQLQYYKDTKTEIETKERETKYGWLTYKDLGILIDSVAKGIVAMGIPIGSHVGIAGYNDIEFVVADLALARAGMVSVGIHGTYTSDQAVFALRKSECVALLYMSDLEINQQERAEHNLWDVKSIFMESCQKSSGLPLLKYFVLMDANWFENTIAGGSFLEFVQTEPTSNTQLLNPFDARGATFRDGNEKTTTDTNSVASVQDEPMDVTTILFTSGSSGAPKAVAIGIDAFVEDISGEITDAYAATSGLTISYIPLSHSSDRYKVWQHIIFGGRTAFVPFGADQWEWREKNKTASPGASPVEKLFDKVASVRATSMSCPPNIWAGLHDMYRRQLLKCNGNQTTALDILAAKTLGTPSRMNSFATGGAPTPPNDLHFAKMFSLHVGASFTDSYGTTEAGALTSDGRQLSDKFKEVEIQLIGVGKYTANANVGEIVVKSSTLALGYMNDYQKTKDSFLHIVDQTKENNKDGLSIGKWYRTGDLGLFDGTGKLILMGRMSSMMGSIVPMVHEVAMLSEWSGKANGNVLHVVLMSISLNKMCCIIHTDVGVTPLEIEQNLLWKNSLAVDALRDAIGDGVELIFYCTNDEWNVVNGLMTGSQKVSSAMVKKKYLVLFE